MKEQLKAEHLQARIGKVTDKIRTLVLLLGEVDTEEKRTGKPVDDAWVVSKIRKIIASNELCLKERPSDKLVAENAYLQSLLPKMMTEEELKAALAKSNANNIGQAMGYLKANHAGLYDGAMASKLAKQMF